MLLVLVLRRPFARLFGAGSRLCACGWCRRSGWLMPPLPSFAPAMPKLVPPETLVVFAGDLAAPLPPDGGPGQWVPLLLAIWAGGAAAFLRLAIPVLSPLPPRAQPFPARPSAPIAACRWSRATPCRGRSRSACSIAGSSSLADFETRYSAEERRSPSITRHPPSPRRYLVEPSRPFILALNWFNPVAWLAFRAFRADQELACDAARRRRRPCRGAPRLCPRPDQIREPTRPDCSLPAESCRSTETETENDEDHRSSRARMLAGAAAILALGGLTPRLRQPRPRPAGRRAQAAGGRRPRTSSTRSGSIIHTDREDSTTTTTEHHGRRRRGRA